MISFLKLIRYKNLLMVLLTMVLTKYALLDSLIKESSLANLEFIMLVLSVIFITAGGYVINDIYDVETDQVNKPNKVFIDNKISLKKSWRVYLLFTFIGLFLGVFLSILYLNISLLILYSVSTVFLFIYSKYLKRYALLGNILVSFLTSFTIFIVYLAYESEFTYYNLKSTLYIIITFCLFAFLSTLIREIIKDIEDVNGDLKINAKTLPILIGRKRASKIAFFLTCILLLLTSIGLRFLYFIDLYILFPIFFILLPLLYFMSKLWNAETKKDFSKLSNLLKIIMLFGILSMLFFKFI